MNRCIVPVIVILVIGSLTAYGRGQIPPPPPFIGGNTGDWLGSGPLFGFDDPWGPGFPSGGRSNEGGIEGGGSGHGYGWNPTEPGEDQIPGCNCGDARCNCVKSNKWKCKENIFPPCDYYCICWIRTQPGMKFGDVCPGRCRSYGRPTGGGGGCCNQDEACAGIVGISPGG